MNILPSRKRKQTQDRGSYVPKATFQIYPPAASMYIEPYPHHEKHIETNMVKAFSHRPPPQHSLSGVQRSPGTHVTVGH